VISSDCVFDIVGDFLKMRVAAQFHDRAGVADGDRIAVQSEGVAEQGEALRPLPLVAREDEGRHYGTT
jgi:hypothetical protein